MEKTIEKPGERHRALLDEFFGPVLGEPVWGLRRSVGSMVTFHLGQPSLYVQEPMEADEDAPPSVQEKLARRLVRPVGQYNLRLECCDWVVIVDGQPVGDGSTTEAIAEAIVVLDGQRLLSVGRGGGPGGWTFEFDLGATLNTLPYDDSEQWIFHDHIRHRVLVATAEGFLIDGPMDE